MTATTAKKSDLGVRTASAVVMVAVAGTALWLGEGFWIALVMAVALGVLWEWRALANAIDPSASGRAVWMVGGMLYIGTATAVLLYLRKLGLSDVLLPITAVIATDVGAYFSGRTIGGPKIAPLISPSKTWSGLMGAAVAASMVIISENLMDHGSHSEDMPLLWRIAIGVILGTGLAIIAQAGDFFESWMKRRAGVKDSGRLIPGHGGLFDRVDGLLAVLFVIGVLYVTEAISTL